MMLRRLFFTATLVLSAAAYGADTDILAGVPPAPKGYDTFEEAQADVKAGKLEMVEYPPIPDSIAVHSDIVFSDHGKDPQKLDVYVPKDIDAPRPCIIFVHGGGWSAGKKEHYLAYTIHFAKLGYVTASIDYRLIPDYTWPAQYQDVTCGIRYLADHAGEYHIDPARLALVGDSAGGHLVLMAAYGEGIPLECPDAPDAKPAPVACVVNLYGVTDCTTPLAIQAHQVIGLIGKPYSEAPEMYAQASPLKFVRPGLPPTLTLHGTIDELVPLSQAERLHEALDGAEVDNYFVPVAGWPHSMDTVKSVSDYCLAVMGNFFAAYLGDK